MAALFLLLGLGADVYASEYRFDRTPGHRLQRDRREKTQAQRLRAERRRPLPRRARRPWRRLENRLTNPAHDVRQESGASRFFLFCDQLPPCAGAQKPCANRGLPRRRPVDPPARSQAQDRPQPHWRNRLLGRRATGFTPCHDRFDQGERPEGCRHKNRRRCRRWRTNRFPGHPRKLESALLLAGGSRGEKPEIYDAASPAAFVDKDDAPIFFYNGSTDCSCR